MTRSTASRAVLAVTAAVLAAVTALTACSSRTHHPAASSTHSAATVAIDGTRDLAQACSALVAFDAMLVNYPGAESGDSGSPPPSQAQLASWAATASAPLQIIAANVPAQLDPSVTTLQTAVTAAAHGTPMNVTDPALIAALTTIDRGAHDNCGFPQLDMTATGTELGGVPKSLAAGPVSISFTNHAPTGRAGFVLLIARVHDGATYTLDQIRTNTVDLTDIADVLVAAQPTTPTATAYANVSLRPGRYIVTTPVGTPPRFSATLATELTVT